MRGIKQTLTLLGTVLLATSSLAQHAQAQRPGIREAAPDSARASVAGNDSHALYKLAIGHTMSGELPAGGTRTYALELPPGLVAQGSFNGGGATLDLLDDQGRLFRRLGQSASAQQNFMWVTHSLPQTLLVRAPNDHGVNYELGISKTLEPANRPATGADSAAPTSPRLRALLGTVDAGGTTDVFWAEQTRQGTPMVEPVSETESLVTFLWRGADDNVRLFGSPSGNHDPLTRLGNSDVWWASFRMPNTARLSYRLAPDVPTIQGTKTEQRRVILATAQRDPLNPSAFPPNDASRVDIFQGNSVLTLPQAPAQPWVTQRAGVNGGVLKQHRLESAVLGNTRDIWTYRPAGGKPQALLVMFDAQAYLAQVPTTTIIDNLIADGLIPRTAVVLIDNPTQEARGRELPPNPDFTAFLDQELMPWIQAQSLATPRERTVIAGSSYGGLASAYAGLQNPQWFGNVLSLSGSYWWSPPGSIPGWMMRQYAQAAKRDVRFYLDAGRYEAARAGQDGILETNRHLGDVLRAKGYTVTQVEHDTGHDYLHWQGSLGCGLVALLNPDQFVELANCGGREVRR